jgi:hypothetical protein
MAYPQPGQYPAYPQYPGQPGAAAKPPAPKTVQNAFTLMLVGAGVRLISGIISLATISKVRDAIRDANPLYSQAKLDDVVHVTEGAVVIGTLIGIGLWIWMAFANRGGANWARITGTVFFGIDCLSVIGALAASKGSTLGSDKASGIGIVFAVLEWLVGLGAVILLWNKQSGPYFSKTPGYGGAPYPYPYPQQPPYPGGPDVPQQPYGGQPQPPHGGQQPPSDPWSNPPQQ